MSDKQLLFGLENKSFQNILSAQSRAAINYYLYKSIFLNTRTYITQRKTTLWNQPRYTLIEIAG